MIIKFKKKFDKSYNKLDVKIKNNFKLRLKLFLENPFEQILNNHLLNGDYKGYRSINVTGDYRAILKNILIELTNL